MKQMNTCILRVVYKNQRLPDWCLHNLIFVNKPYAFSIQCLTLCASKIDNSGRSHQSGSVIKAADDFCTEHVSSAERYLKKSRCTCWGLINACICQMRCIWSGMITNAYSLMRLSLTRNWRLLTTISLYLSWLNNLYRPFMAAVKNWGYSVTNTSISYQPKVALSQSGRWRKTPATACFFLEHLPRRKTTHTILWLYLALRTERLPGVSVPEIRTV